MKPFLFKYDLGLDIIAFSTMRNGGIGKGSYSSFNIAHYCGDNPVHVHENRVLLCKELGIDESKLFLPYQTHGVSMCEVDKKFLSLNKEEQSKLLYGVDVIYTREKGVCIGVSTADCVPILLYDECRHIIVAIHAGWRGTVSKITEKTIIALKQKFVIDSLLIKAVIAPSISLEYFEVGDEVYDAYEKADFPMQKIAKRYGNKWHIDLWEANRLQLMACGLQEKNIVVSGICTYASYERFFSARRLGLNSGRIFNGIMML